ncbi:gamma-aminobutyric acid receptor subunit beta-4-like isoform X1 [Stylophora pistillata]|uniref:Gamma-aminobutyric acid receptor subunit beta-4 n=1 Tax=Stylophora pistillata TaxID=50429 RepID=A0A2B4SK07_STYPI|nr:gamma-aminobutyric acid receptor subunit beta-4-like isoform X1 [Stylophora pistillata]PFX28867.1 Gamma-aminobutyric acid receptor subunit beta-4 [Stylophora pistillata]
MMFKFYIRAFGVLLRSFMVLANICPVNATKTDDSKRAVEVDIADGSLPPLTEPPNATAILDKMFVNYDKRLRPMYGGDPVYIYVSLGFLSISHVTEENMEFKGDIYMRQFWKDPRLAYGDKNWTLILQGDILRKMWFPDTYIENGKKTTIHDDTRTVIVFGDGNVFYSVRVTVNAMGLMDFKNYPMDVQLFFFRVLSYGFDITQIRYKWIGASLYSTDMAEFYVMNQTLASDKVKYMIGWFDYLDVNFHVRRRIGHYVIRIFFPCILCTVVSWLPFWMDRNEIGDRGALGITTLLTEVFLLQYTNDSMPRVSYVKAADLFLIVSFAFTFMALLESVIVYNYKKKSFMAESTQTKSLTGGRTFFRKRTAKVEEVCKAGTVHINGSYINPTVPAEPEDPPRPLPEPQGKKAPWKEPEDEKQELPRCSALSKSKIRSYYTSVKSYLAKTDLSFFIEMSSRILFPLMYIGFIAFFFGKYGI